jgi:hypothetical protein
MGRVWDGKKKTETLVSSMREDVGVLHSKGLLKDNYNMHLFLHTE